MTYTIDDFNRAIAIPITIKMEQQRDMKNHIGGANKKVAFRRDGRIMRKCKCGLKHYKGEIKRGDKYWSIWLLESVDPWALPVRQAQEFGRLREAKAAAREALDG